MKKRTVSELAFEAFCDANALPFERIEECAEPTPDYILRINSKAIYVEVKQIDEDTNFSSTLMTRSPGSHIRTKIDQARHQIRAAAQQGFPAIMLVYNNLDPLQMFGTDSHDFLAAMYGDLTMHASRTTRALLPSIMHDRNQSFRDGKNNQFSAIGWLHRRENGLAIHLYENTFASVPLEFDSLPAFISFNRVEIEYD